MTKIDPSSPLLAQIRAQAAAWKRQTAGRGAAGGPEEQSRDISEAPEDWSAQVASGLAAIGPDDPQRQRKAFRIHLQAVLARECRIRSLNDPLFQDLLDRVQQTMEADPRLQTAIATAGDMLLRNVAR
jgi:hypothetical protein